MIRCRKCHLAQCTCGAEDWEDYQTGGEAKAENASLRTQVEQLRQRVQELEFALAEVEALEMSHGERIEKQAKRIHELETQLEKNNPLLDEAADAIDKLTAERDELLAAAEAIEINAEECLDFDECTAMLVQIDDYHKLMEAIASVKEK